MKPSPFVAGTSGGYFAPKARNPVSLMAASLRVVEQCSALVRGDAKNRQPAGRAAHYG
ncbi:hypothetical protein [Sphingomonas edaphi]|uniref:hypothetical protein n=1 Tax=Sphingomonas edaphi TaxID=2315689 RepID=UPI0013145F94|nr:hypothetical protein [Sphingomonas edaphi]